MKKEIEVDVQMCVRQNSCSDKFGKIQTKSTSNGAFFDKVANLVQVFFGELCEIFQVAASVSNICQ